MAIDYNHPDLGHGTHCAGIVGAIMGNGIGVIGVAPEADLYAVKVFPDNSNTGYAKETQESSHGVMQHTMPIFCG